MQWFMHHFYYLGAFRSSETKCLQRDGCVLVASLRESSQVWISAQNLARFGYSLSALVQIQHGCAFASNALHLALQIAQICQESVLD